MSTTELSLGPDAIRQITTGEVAMQVIDHKQVESLLAAERRTLEMIAGGASLTDVLEDLCDTIDDQAPEIISSILLMDPNGEQLWPAAGRRVPEGWVRTITPLPIGPGMGSCGTAAFLKKPVIISDIASDPPWSDITAPDYREIALSYGLRAAWSQPLISKDDELLGTFAIYYRQPRQPSDSDLKLIEGAANIAVMGERSQTALKNAFEEIKQSEARLRKIIDTIPTLAWCGLPDASKEFFNKRWHDYTGLSPEEASGWGWKVTIHPDDLEKLMDRSFKFIASEEPGEVEARMRRFDGEYRWFLFRAEPLHDEHGFFIRKMWRGSATNAGKPFQEASRLKTNNGRGAETDSIDGFSFITSRCGMNRGKSFAGMRPAPTSKIESKLKSRSEVKTWRCAKKSTTPRCSKKSSVRLRRYTLCCGKSLECRRWTRQF